MFDSADTSGNKLLDVDEVKSLLERLGIKLDNQDEARMIKDCDENNDNELSFEEFNQLMKKIQAGEYGHVNIDESKKVQDPKLVQSAKEIVPQDETIQNVVYEVFGVQKPKPQPKKVEVKAEPPKDDLDENIRDKLYLEAENYYL